MVGAKQWKTSIAGILIVGAALVGGIFVYVQGQSASIEEDGPDPSGTLILCGGGSIPKAVFERFVACAGGRAARIVVMPAYYPTTKEKRELISEWRAHGVASVEILSAASRRRRQCERQRDAV